MSMNINIILFSNLDASNGGVETWLRLFIEEVNSGKNYFDKVNIYYYRRPGETVRLMEADPHLINYCPIDLPHKKGGLLSNFITLIKFHYASIKRIRSARESVVISIGSYPSGIFDWAILKLLGYRKKVSHFIWLRTTLSKHIKTHNSRIFSPLIFACEKRALKDANTVIANGWDTRDNYIKEYGIMSEVIPNAIALNNYAGIPPVETLENNLISIAFIGRFYESKGAPNFVNAISVFNAKYPELRDKVNFTFVGWGEKLVEEFATITDNCTLVGRVPNDKMNNILANVHCGVALTKSNETDAGGSGVSNGLLELMAAGRIIITYDNIIYRQFPRDDFMIFIEENNDIMLAEVFSHIVFSLNGYLSLAKNAREYITQFSIENHVKMLRDVVSNVIQQ